MRIRWSLVEPICSEVTELAANGLSCWLEDAEGRVVAGTRAIGDAPGRCPVNVGGEDVATAFALGTDGERWAAFLAASTARELTHQITIGNMADATARLWKHTNALMRMAACVQVAEEPAGTVNSVLCNLRRSTRLLAGIALIRLPDSEVYTAFREDGIDTVEPLMLAPMYGLSGEVRVIGDDEATDGLKSACAQIVGSDQPVALARLTTDHDDFGYLLAPVEDVETVTSDDLKMFTAAAQIISVAVENGCTLIKEREATRLHVENELLSEQTRDMEEMVHIVAHDLRSPMTALYGFLHVALDELKDLRGRLEEEGFAAIGPYADSCAEPLRDGIRSVEKLNRMVQRLLEFSRAARAAFSFERVELDLLVRGVTRSLGYQLNKREIKVEVAEMPCITGDRVQLEAVFGNLIDNAIKYMGDTEERSIEIGCEPGPEPIYFVRDSGEGMTADQMAKAFLPFQRFHSDAAPGDGIGLPHVRKIIERHSGRIWCESQKGDGTTFYFTLGAPTPVGRMAEALDIHTRQASQTPVEPADEEAEEPVAAESA